MSGLDFQILSFNAGIKAAASLRARTTNISEPEED
jgi:hypothetical protein